MAKMSRGAIAETVVDREQRPNDIRSYPTAGMTERRSCNAEMPHG